MISQERSPLLEDLKENIFQEVYGPAQKFVELTLTSLDNQQRFIPQEETHLFEGFNATIFHICLED